MNKRQRKKKKNLKRAIRLTFNKFDKMSDMKFKAMLDKYDAEHEANKCYPETCNGECQGTGWCEVATDFRNNTIPEILSR